MKLNKISTCLVGIGLFGALSASNASAAGWPVTDFELIGYMSGMATNGGNGVVELLTSLNSTLAQGNAMNRNNEKNKVILDNEIELYQSKQKAIVNRTPDRAACVSATVSSGAGGGAINTAKQGASKTTEKAQEIADPARSDFKYEEAIKDKGKVGICTINDVKLKLNGCSAVGDYSMMSGNSASILYKPQTDQEIKQGNAPIGGLNKDEQAVREAAIKLLVGVEGLDQLTSPVKANSLEGQKYLYAKDQDAYRKTLAYGAMQKASTIEYQIPEKESKQLLEHLKWGGDGPLDPKTVWTDVFGNNAKFPTQPSEWDLLTYQVYSKYGATNSGSFQVTVGQMQEQELLQNIARMDAVNLRLQMLQVEYQRDANNLLASMLSVMLENKNEQDKVDLNKSLDVSLDK